MRCPRLLVSLLPPLLPILVTTRVEAKQAMTLTSPAFAQNGAMPDKFTCKGENESPPLSISGVPREAKSLALVMEDPDAPGGVWVHWVLWNIEPGTTGIPQGSVPPGAEQGTNSWSRQGYGGPCPPSGTHRYFFVLFALKERLTLPSSATSKELLAAMRGKILARSELIGRYSHR